MKVAIYYGHKMVLPHYGKTNSMYGWFTTEGFVTLYDMDNYQNLTIEPPEYSEILNVEDEEEYNDLNFPEW